MCAKEREPRSGRTDPCTRGTGRMTNAMEKDALFTPTVMCMKAAGGATRPTGLASTITKMEPSTAVSGKKTNRTGREKRRGQTAHHSKEHSPRV